MPGCQKQASNHAYLASDFSRYGVGGLGEPTMRVALLGAGLAFGFSGSALADTFVLYGKGDHTASFVDMTKIKSIYGGKTVWSMVVFEKPRSVNGKLADYIFAKQTLDCQREVATTEFIGAYSLSSSSPIGSSTFNDQPQPIVPGTEADAERRIVCEGAKPTDYSFEQTPGDLAAIARKTMTAPRSTLPGNKKP